MSDSHIPPGYGAITPILVVDDVVRVIEFVTTGLGGAEVFRMPGPDGKIIHAEVVIDGSRVMIGNGGLDSPPVKTTLYFYVPDCDLAFATAIAAGGTEVEAPKDQVWGDRTAKVADPEGNIWYIAYAKERLSADQVMDRIKAESA